MRTVLGLLLILAGIILGVYVGVWVCFVGGIIDILNEFKKPETLDAANVAWGIAKIFFASICGVGSAFACFIPGAAMIASDN